jgi:hypothetical protein
MSPFPAVVVKPVTVRDAWDAVVNVFATVETASNPDVPVVSIARTAVWLAPFGVTVRVVLVAESSYR